MVSIVEGRGISRGQIGFTSVDLTSPECITSYFTDNAMYAGRSYGNPRTPCPAPPLPLSPCPPGGGRSPARPRRVVPTRPRAGQRPPATGVVHMYHSNSWGGWSFQLAARNDTDSSLTFACTVLRRYTRTLTKLDVIKPCEVIYPSNEGKTGPSSLIQSQRSISGLDPATPRHPVPLHPGLAVNARSPD